MRNKKSFIFAVFAVLALFASGCAFQEQATNEGVLKTDITDISKSKNYVNILKIVKSNTNLAWAAAAKIVIVSGNASLKNTVWQGDMSAYRYGGNSNIKASTAQLMTDDIQQMILTYPTVRNRGSCYTTSYLESLITIDYSIWIQNSPVIIVCQRKIDNWYFPIVIYAADRDINRIWVWDPTSGYDYYCDYTAFANNANYNYYSVIFSNR